MAGALGRLKDPAAANALAEAALGDPNATVANTARKAYTNVTGHSVEGASLSLVEAIDSYRRRFNHLLLIEALDDQGMSISGSRYTPGAVSCCAICRSRAERYIRLEVEAHRSNMVYSYRVGVPVCRACQIDGFPPAEVRFARDWSIEFRNSGFATMNTDSSWLATAGFASSNVIF